MTKRLSRLLSEVAEETLEILKTKHGFTDKELDRIRTRIKSTGYGFPIGLALLKFDLIWIDYEVQREVIANHVLNIIRKFDPRIVGAASCVRLPKSKYPNRYYAYDGQHRMLAMWILGYTEIPACYVETDNERFASEAFEILNDSGIKKIGKPDLHRIRLHLFSKGSEDKAVLQARKLQNQFDTNKVDLQEQSHRKSPGKCGPNFNWYSHFDSSYKCIKQDPSGKTLNEILNAIRTVFPNQDEIDQGVFIGLMQMARLNIELTVDQPKDWMIQVLRDGVAKTFNDSHMVHKMAKDQWEFAVGNWSAPDGMSKFMREMYKLHGGKLTLPTKGHGLGILPDGDGRTNLCESLKPALQGVA
jgi:hypothetical protein